jgi:L,D-transpeptidase catalytic domain
MRVWLLQILTLTLALAASLGPAAAKVEIRVDLTRQQMTVIKNHEPPIVWKISSGRAGFETPTGSFIVQRLDADHLSDEYDQAPMPSAIFFSRGLAIHGTYERGLGRPASHGCVRLSVEHARELFDWVERYGASIEIDGVAPTRGAVYAAASRARAGRGVVGERRGPPPPTPGDDFSLIRGW